MHYHKFPYPANFEFLQAGRPGQALKLGPAAFKLEVASFDGDLFRVCASGAAWGENRHLLALNLPPKRRAAPPAGACRLEVTAPFGFRLVDGTGETLLDTVPGATFGINGAASLFQFVRPADAQFYGMGEKALGLELSGRQTKCWNTDVWGDFAPNVYLNGRPDPMYVAIPYVILKRGNSYVGLYLHNPYSTFLSTREITQWEPPRDVRGPGHPPAFWFGCENGQPELYVLVGPSLAELTRKFQTLLGTTPLPPAWALGYQQCRWGYQSAADLNELDAQFRKHDIPCDGLWLDIDYMRDYRVFTVNEKHFPAVKKDLAKLNAKGRRIVPILDPGVKREPGYPVYDSGHRADLFCHTPQHGEFVGLVWPGETVFPDFSLPEARAWWASHVRDFANLGFAGSWLDMNDPSTGCVECGDMRFRHGTEAHEAFHNQYALGMAMASRDGYLAARPDTRPFLLCRSGCAGTGAQTAIWTGDNASNYHHLRGTIALSLNLALSGVPFNGPDIGGFGCDTTAPLLTDWMKTCFLFPVARNHSTCGSRQQEPWAFGPQTLRVLRHYIQLRYKLRPYLYNLFARQEETGEAILRPLFHDFADSAKLPLGKIDDQFLVGPAVMQAPFVDEQAKSRRVVLPGPAKWYAAHEARWLAGNRTVTVKADADTTPLYLRGGAIVPMAKGEIGADHAFDGRAVEFHCFLPPAFRGVTETDYVFDDGESFAYRDGKRSKVRVTARGDGKGGLAVTLDTLADGFGACKAAFVLYAPFRQITVNGRAVKPKAGTWTLAGQRQRIWRCG